LVRGAKGGAVSTVPTILIADDDVAVRRTITQHLVRGGYGVRETSTGKEALDVIRGGGVDLVIADVYMPDMDGIEFISRASQEVGAPKVIVMSGGGHRDKETVLAMASRLGAAQTLEKPFSRDQLLEAVRAQLGTP